MNARDVDLGDMLVYANFNLLSTVSAPYGAFPAWNIMQQLQWDATIDM
jgi:hypothetical protein